MNSKFAFQGLCWEKSHIPLVIWKAGEANSNLIESVHADVNREGVSCTLVGGVKKGRVFDSTKMKTLRVSTLYLIIATNIISDLFISRHLNSPEFVPPTSLDIFPKMQKRVSSVNVCVCYMISCAL